MAPATTASPASRAAALKLARAADPDRVTGLGQGQAARVGAVDPELGQRPGERDRAVDPGQAGHDVGGVVAAARRRARGR